MSPRGVGAFLATVVVGRLVGKINNRILITIGLFTRPAAFIVCGEMALAFFTQHFPKDFWPLVNGGELAVLYCFAFLLLVFAGPGWLAVDHFIRRGAPDTVERADRL